MSRAKPTAAQRADLTAEIEKLIPPPPMELPKLLVDVVAGAYTDVAAIGERQAAAEAACAVLRALADNKEHTWLHDSDLLMLAERIHMSNDNAA